MSPQALPRLLPPPSSDLVDRRKALVEDLMLSTGGRGSLKLAHVMRQGVAFHHSGLTSQVRQDIAFHHPGLPSQVCLLGPDIVSLPSTKVHCSYCRNDTMLKLGSGADAADAYGHLHASCRCVLRFPRMRYTTSSSDHPIPGLDLDISIAPSLSQVSTYLPGV